MSDPLNHISSEMDSSQSEESLTIPVLREGAEIHIALRKTGSVRIQKIVRETEENISVPLASETVEVERVPKDLLTEAPPSIRIEGDVTIIPVVEEVLILTKQFILIRRLRITKRRSLTESLQTVTLRSEELTVERETSKD